MSVLDFTQVDSQINEIVLCKLCDGAGKDDNGKVCTRCDGAGRLLFIRNFEYRKMEEEG